MGSFLHIRPAMLSLLSAQRNALVILGIALMLTRTTHDVSPNELRDIASSCYVISAFLAAVFTSWSAAEVAAASACSAVIVYPLHGNGGAHDPYLFISIVAAIMAITSTISHATIQRCTPVGPICATALLAGTAGASITTFPHNEPYVWGGVIAIGFVLLVALEALTQFRPNWFHAIPKEEKLK
jgi:hypothetical protein